MKGRIAILFALSLFLAGMPAYADTFSFTGTLADPTTPVEITLVLGATADVTLQTYGFGGGTNALNAVIAAGGTDPFLAVFAGTGAGATILTDALSNPFGTSLDLNNYGSFMGCPPAGAPTIGGSPQCGDITMNLTGLVAGTYTIILSDGQYIANAVFDNGTLGEGFTDLTGGQFCNLIINGVACPANGTPGNGAYALDIITSEVPVPEPGTLLMLGAGLLGIGWRRRVRA